MLRKIADEYEVTYMEGLTGFKWIAKMVKDFPELTFIGGGEESFGYMVGDFVRDKDAVTATLLACEIAAQKKSEGSSVYQYLKDIEKQFGLYKEALISVVKKGKKGSEEIAAIMKSLRENPFTEIAGSKVVKIEDYLTGEARNIIEGDTEKLDIPTSNVFNLLYEDGSKIAARPSGTEPKIKFYISVNDPERVEETLQKRIEDITAHLNIS